ncbi:hypothetical protein ILUMI_16435, partial [Ignelater luminosus]
SLPEPSGVNSLEASAAQNQEEAEVVQVPDTDDLLRPVIGSTNLSASLASAAIAEIDFDGNDIGKWPGNIDSNIRLLLIQRGPEVVQHINTDFTKDPTISRSVQSDTDAITWKVLSRRRLTREWFYRTLTNGEKVLRTWMAYSPSKAPLFCFCCRLFENAHSPNASKFYTSDEFNTWWKLNPKVSNHESSALHIKIFANGRSSKQDFKKDKLLIKKSKKSSQAKQKMG